MNRPLIKICGVRSPEIARVVADAGADLMGLIFAPSRRQVTEEQARLIVAGLRVAPPVMLSRSEASASGSSGDAARTERSFAAAQDDRGAGAAIDDRDDRDVIAAVEGRPDVVGVFVNERIDVMNRMAESVGLDFIQLSGDEPAEIQGELVRPVIRALRLPAGITLDEASHMAEQYLDCPVRASALLLDTHVSGSYGGNGIPGDWEVAQGLAERYPVILAGGLRPETVADALRTVRPFGVDVSSGVETNGVKDAGKIRQFISAARAAALPAGRAN